MDILSKFLGAVVMFTLIPFLLADKPGLPHGTSETPLTIDVPASTPRQSEYDLESQRHADALTLGNQANLLWDQVATDVNSKANLSFALQKAIEACRLNARAVPLFRNEYTELMLAQGLVTVARLMKAVPASTLDPKLQKDLSQVVTISVGSSWEGVGSLANNIFKKYPNNEAARKGLVLVTELHAQ